MESNLREMRLNLRLSEQEFELVEQAASQMALRAGSFARSILVRAAKSHLQRANERTSVRAVK